MCGIIGCAGAIHNREKDAFQDLLIFSQVRGPHSTGVASVSRGNERDFKLAKVIGRPDMLIDYDKRYDKVVDYGKRFMLGHNRSPTQGKVNQKNAHPYGFENILGCHNGTVPDYRLRELKKDYTQYGTDSEAVLACIDDQPLQEVMRTLSGAWAFVWYDRRDDTVNFLRNPDRYLCYCYSEDRKTLFWASEAGFLNAALSRNKIKYSTIYEVTEGMHTRWKIPEANKEFDKARQSKIVSNEWVNTGRFQGHTSANDEDVSDVGGRNIVGPIPSANHQAGGAKTVVAGGVVTNLDDIRSRMYPNPLEKSREFETSNNLKNFDGQGYIKKKGNKDFYRGFHGEILNRSQFLDTTKDGCCWCDAPSVWGQPVRFLSKEGHMCLKCTKDDEVRMACGAKS